MIYLYLDASVRGLFKQKYSPTELMHSPITKSDHSGPPRPQSADVICERPLIQLRSLEIEQF